MQTQISDYRQGGRTRSVKIRLARKTVLEGDLTLGDERDAFVVFAHGSGSSRHSSRNRRVASTIQAAGIGTLLFDLLTPEEEDQEQLTRHLRFDIPILTERLIRATEWLRCEEGPRMRVGYFGASTGAAAALGAAALAPRGVRAVVSRGGRPDLAGDHLPRVKAPTLLIVGGADEGVVELNQAALAALRAPRALELVPGATHLFEEPGALEKVSTLATQWFSHWMSDADEGTHN